MDKKKESVVSQGWLWLFFVAVFALVTVMTVAILCWVETRETLVYQQREIDRLEELLGLPDLPKDGNGPTIAELIEQLNKKPTKKTTANPKGPAK